MKPKESSKVDKKKISSGDKEKKIVSKTSSKKEEKAEAVKPARLSGAKKSVKKTASTFSRESAAENKPLKYWEAVGRRKRAIARVRLFTRGEKEAVVNGKAAMDYFPTVELRDIAFSALQKMKSIERFRVVVHVAGGGIHGQAEAVRHATSRALTKFNPDFRIRLRKAGYLTRDPREKERRKYGLKKARRAPQWQKR